MNDTEARKMAGRPLNELLTRDMVDIYVGPESTHWILHEKLLCARSTFFRKTFYTSQKSGTSSPQTKSIGLEEDDNVAFTSFVAWLYSATVPPPNEEKDLGILLELYLMSERWGIEKLQHDMLDVVRHFYHKTATYPGLRRVQYVYANTESGSPMRELLVDSVARMLVLGEGGKDGRRRIPLHWDKALRKNGQLAVDLISRIQSWEIPREDVPDARETEEIKDEQKPVSGEQEPEGKTPGRQIRAGVPDSGNKSVLDKELPSGLVNGIDHSDNER